METDSRKPRFYRHKRRMPFMSLPSFPTKPQRKEKTKDKEFFTDEEGRIRGPLNPKNLSPAERAWLTRRGQRKLEQYPEFEETVKQHRRFASRFRRAEKERKQTLKELYKLYQEGMKEGKLMWTPYVAVAKSLEQNTILIERRNGRIVGFLRYTIGKRKPVARLQQVYVDPKYRGQRIGSQLLTQFEEIATKQGMEKIRLKTAQTNLPAIRFYEKHGFTRVAEGGKKVPEFVYEKSVTPSSQFKHTIGFDKGNYGSLKGGSKKRTYTTDSSNCPQLHPAKLEQRKVLADEMKSKGTVLEVFAGKGHLTKEVYAPKAEKVVLVDKDEKALAQAERRLKGRVKREIWAMDNIDWLKKEMRQEQVKNLKLVDFDAFGSPATQVRTFFNNYEVKRPLLVALTDGSAIYLGFRQNAEGRKWLRKHYGIDVLPNKRGHLRYGTREGQVAILNKFMEEQGRKHRFDVQPISVAHGDVKTIYAGYKVTPKK